MEMQGGFQAPARATIDSEISSTESILSVQQLALKRAGSQNPVLLRVDADAGHGIGSTKSQNDELYADMYAFVFWRAGMRGWQPALKP
jgi:protease II